MEQSKKISRKVISILLSLLMVFSCFSGMGLTAYADNTETLLTTITATGKEQANYSTANVATVSFSYTAGGSSAYYANWGWWGYGWSATVNAAEGYTITKCVFYDDEDRTATDSSSPFVVETTEEDKTPQVNGTPILAYTSKGITKIEVYGYKTPPTEMLTKITPTGIDTYSESVAGVVTVTLSNISRYRDCWAYGGTVTVAPKEGYTITKCIFDARAGAVEDTEAPFSIDVGSATYVYSVEVYGYKNPSSGPDKTDLNTAITAAETLYDSIKDDTNYSTIASTLKTAIDAAKEVADSDEADQDAVDAAKTAITTAKTNAEAAKKDVDDTNAANAVITKINALPAADDVTTANKEAIEAARAAYNALTDDQKKKVDATVLAKLTDAETALQDAIDTETAQGATDTINALPDADKVTTADKDAIEAARKAYNDLTDDQKKKVSDDTLKKLTDAEDALKAAEQKDADDTAAAQSATDTINNLPDADKVTTSDKEAIEAARAAYDALTDDQKAKVAPETLQKLVDDEAALKEAEDTAAAQTVTDEINALPDADKVTTSDKEAIEKARAAYEALTDEQKAKVSDDTLKKLADAETALAAAEKDAADEEAAKAVTDAINALPSSDKVATTDKEAIEKARAAYDALTDDQKAKVPAEAVKALEDAEKALTEAEKVAAEEAAAKELAAAKKNAKTAMNNQITVTQKGKKITVKWHKASQADGYFVYVQYCGKKYKKPVKTIKKNSTTKVTIKKLNGKKINLKKNFKVVVKPYKIVNGKKVVLAKSMTAHVVGVKNKKYTNVKSIKATKKALTVKVGKTKKAKAKITLVDKKKKHIPSSHAPKFRYRTSNKSIATVDKNGKIKGIKKGTCTIYIYSINGKMTKIKVTVK